jgi:hypothetical protein
LVNRAPEAGWPLIQRIAARAGDSYNITKALIITSREHPTDADKLRALVRDVEEFALSSHKEVVICFLRATFVLPILLALLQHSGLLARFLRHVRCHLDVAFLFKLKNRVMPEPPATMAEPASNELLSHASDIFLLVTETRGLKDNMAEACLASNNLLKLPRVGEQHLVRNFKSDAVLLPDGVSVEVKCTLGCRDRKQMDRGFCFILAKHLRETTVVKEAYFKGDDDFFLHLNLENREGSIFFLCYILQIAEIYLFVSPLSGIDIRSCLKQQIPFLSVTYPNKLHFISSRGALP